MPLLFEIVETTKVEKHHDSFDIRLLKREQDWGVDTTKSMNPVFGYSENGARNTYHRICSSYSKDN